ncbi:MAG TPA: DUF3592 domain-containing protein [Candidatus Obscuribacterales bacterium]
MFSAISALFGGLYNQLGWGVLGFSLIFFWVFSYDAWVVQARFSGPMQGTQGLLIKSERTSSSEGKVKIFRHHFSFSYQGQPYQGVSYTTGLPEKGQGAEGEKVPVEFNPDKPAASRIALEGFRETEFSFFTALFMPVFVLVALLILIPALVSGVRMLRLLRVGRLARGSLTTKVPTGQVIRINRQIFPIYNLTFTYSVAGQNYKVNHKTHQPGVLEDDEKEAILYSPAHPAFAALLDAMPGKMHIDAQGRIQAQLGTGSLIYLVLPGLTMGLHSLILLVKLAG